MLASLKIENVAVIEKAEVNFTPGFNVLTGETGAGKSILIDSINAILGNRTSRELVRSGAQKACIWQRLRVSRPPSKSSWKNAATSHRRPAFVPRDQRRGQGQLPRQRMPATRRWCGTFRRACSPSTASMTARA